MSMLYVVATPIGNLEDITLRALRILREVDVVLCEDTRMTKKLLAHFDIHTPALSYHSHSTDKKEDSILELLREGKTLALVSDAGTPGISDPGVSLIARVRRECGEVKIESVPGPTALTAALSIIGFPTQPMTFLGFPPHKKGRETFFTQLSEYEHTVVFYESTHRLVKALEAIREKQPERQMAIAKELTKIHERVLFGTAEELLGQLENDPVLTKGEFVCVLAPQDFSSLSLIRL